MASHDEEELEYDSDPEDAKRSLAMRRREAASDDEEGGRELSEERPRMDRRAPILSDESDGRGGVADYDEDEEEEYVEDEEEYIEDEEGEEAYEEEEEEIVDGKGEVEEGMDRSEARVSGAGTGTGGGADAADVGMENEMHGNTRRNVEEVAADVPAGNNVEEEEEEEEEKKENEPFAVPTAGAFYMHDDRFRDNAAGRNRYCCYHCGFMFV